MCVLTQGSQNLVPEWGMTSQSNQAWPLPVTVVFIWWAARKSHVSLVENGRICFPDVNVRHVATGDDELMRHAFRITGPLWGESTNYRWISVIKGWSYRPLLCIPYCDNKKLLNRWVASDLMCHDAHVTPVTENTDAISPNKIANTFQMTLMMTLSKRLSERKIRYSYWIRQNFVRKGPIDDETTLVQTMNNLRRFNNHAYISWRKVIVKCEWS